MSSSKRTREATPNESSESTPLKNRRVNKEEDVKVGAEEDLRRLTARLCAKEDLMDQTEQVIANGNAQLLSGNLSPDREAVIAARIAQARQDHAEVQKQQTELQAQITLLKQQTLPTASSSSSSSAVQSPIRAAEMKNLDQPAQVVDVFVCIRDDSREGSELLPPARLQKVEVTSGAIEAGVEALRTAVAKRGIQGLWLDNHTELKSTAMLGQKFRTPQLFAEAAIIPPFVCPGCAETFSNRKELFNHAKAAEHKGVLDSLFLSPFRIDVDSCLEAFPVVWLELLERRLIGHAGFSPAHVSMELFRRGLSAKLFSPGQRESRVDIVKGLNPGPWVYHLGYPSPAVESPSYTAMMWQIQQLETHKKDRKTERDIAEARYD